MTDSKKTPETRVDQTVAGVPLFIMWGVHVSLMLIITPLLGVSPAKVVFQLQSTCSGLREVGAIVRFGRMTTQPADQLSPSTNHSVLRDGTS